jgi:hypothetical protein
MVVARRTCVLHALQCKALRDLYAKMTSKRVAFLPQDLFRSGVVPRLCVMVSLFLPALSSVAASPDAPPSL